MLDGVKDQATASPEDKAQAQGFSDKARENFARLEAAKEAEKEARIRAEMKAEQALQELNRLKSAPQPIEKDPLDDVEDYIDKERLQQVRQKDRAAFKREAEEIARKTYEERALQDSKKQYLASLKDYNQVMTPDNIARLEQTNPYLAQKILNMPDPEEQRILAYETIKASMPKVEQQVPVQSIKEKVEENQRNPYYIPSGSGTPTGVEYDLRSQSSREAAYAKLKAAQRNPIGNGMSK